MSKNSVQETIKCFVNCLTQFQKEQAKYEANRKQGKRLPKKEYRKLVSTIIQSIKS